MNIKAKLYRVLGKDMTKAGNKKKETAPGTAADEHALKILLLTNRDSDNVGDQVIEACDMGLLDVVMQNLHVENYKILSRSASLVSKKYMETKEEKYLAAAHRIIADVDVILFGGAPQFNFLYQIFAERTAVILELAEQYQKPVLFSAIGVEGYDENHKDCRRLKRALELDCVKQITTRDDFETLEKYVEDGRIPLARVADPAVFAAEVFGKFRGKKGPKKKVGIFILRANGFMDNKILFSREDAAALWKGLIRELEDRGYDYELLTSGHFGDEAFLDFLIRNYDFPNEKCIFNINTPERLIKKISSYDVLVTCRLHPSIIAYSLGVPSIGVVWNGKVRHFYENIHRQDRLIEMERLSPAAIADKLEQAMRQGPGTRDREFQMSVYNTLFQGMKNILCPDAQDLLPYSYEELLKNITIYQGTSKGQQEEKLRRKFRRIYGQYNELFDTNVMNKIVIGQLKAEFLGYRMTCEGGLQESTLTCSYDSGTGEIRRLVGGNIEYMLNDYIKNDGQGKVPKNQFACPGYVFCGWNMRIKEDEIWYWYLADGSLQTIRDYEKAKNGELMLLPEEGQIPVIPAKYVSEIALRAVWT